MSNIPQFVACGLEKISNCPRQIPYDMAEHDRIIMNDLLDKVAERMNYECYCKDVERPCSSSDCLHCEYGYVDSEKILKVIAEMKAEIEEVEE